MPLDGYRDHWFVLYREDASPNPFPCSCDSTWSVAFRFCPRPHPNIAHAMDKRHTFRATIEHAGGGGAFVTVPFDVENAFGKKRVQVSATIGGVDPWAVSAAVLSSGDGAPGRHAF